MFYDSLYFPDLMSFGASGGPRFSTSLVSSPSGAEAVMSHRPRELGAWTVDLADLEPDEFIEVMALFRICAGRAHGFKFLDHEDDTGTDEFLGLGDGTQTVFPLIKHYDEGLLTYDRLIPKPVPGSVTCALDGTPTSAFTVNHYTGEITFTTAPDVDVAVTASFLFDCAVRCDVDAMDASCDETLATSWRSIRLVELPYAEVITEITAPVVLSGEVFYDQVYEPDGHLSWTMPDLGEVLLVGYRLYRRSGNGLTPPTALLFDTTAPPLQAYIDEDTAEGTIVNGVRIGGYTYGVTVYTALEESPLSNLVWLRTIPDEPPALLIDIEEAGPVEVVIGDPGVFYGIVHVSWAAAVFRGGEPVELYHIYRKVTDLLDPTPPTFLVGSTSALVWEEETIIDGGGSDPDDIRESVLRGPGYTYQVIAESQTGRLLTSAPETIEAHHDTVVPTAPLNLVGVYTYVSFAPGYVTLTWEAPAETGGIGVWWYHVEEWGNRESPEPGDTWEPLSGRVEGDTLTALLNNFYPFGQELKYRLRAQNDWGYSVYSNETSVIAIEG